MTAAETIPVEIRVLLVEPVHSAGRLIGVACVELDVGGVALELQGVQCVITDSGGITVRAPVWRHPRTQRWIPAMILPPALAHAIATEVLAALEETDDPRIQRRTPARLV